MPEYKEPKKTSENSATNTVLTTLSKDMMQNLGICLRVDPNSRRGAIIAKRLNGVIDNIISKAVNGEPNELTANGASPELLLDNEEFFNDLFENSFISDDVKTRFKKELDIIKQDSQKLTEEQKHILETQAQMDDVLAKMMSDLQSQKKDISEVIELLSNDSNKNDFEDLIDMLNNDIVAGVDDILKDVEKCRENKSGYKEVSVKMREFVSNCSDLMEENKEILNKTPKVSGVLNNIVSSVKSFLNTITGNTFSSLFSEQKSTLTAAKSHAEKNIQKLDANIEKLDEVQSKKVDPKPGM
jgi:hypothetical protein